VYTYIYIYRRFRNMRTFECINIRHVYCRWPSWRWRLPIHFRTLFSIINILRLAEKRNHGRTLSWLDWNLSTLLLRRDIVSIVIILYNARYRQLNWHPLYASSLTFRGRVYYLHITVYKKHSAKFQSSFRPEIRRVIS